MSTPRTNMYEPSTVITAAGDNRGTFISPGKNGETDGLSMSGSLSMSSFADQSGSSGQSQG